MRQYKTAVRYGYAMRKIKNIILDIVIIVCLVTLGFSAYKLYKMYEEYSKAEKEYSQLSGRVVKHKTPGIKKEDEKEDEGDECPISIDFDELREINPDVIGWIYCEDTVINYPVLQGKDNDKYLHHTMEGQYNSSGSIFMDAYNKKDLTDFNTVLYGHHMKNGSMFASLKKYSGQDYYEEHPVMWYLTPEKNYKLTVFSGFVEKPDSEIYGVFRKRVELDKYLDKAREKNTFNPNEEVEKIPNEKIKRIMVLSTCDYTFNNARYVLVCIY